MTYTVIKPLEWLPRAAMRGSRLSPLVILCARPKDLTGYDISQHPPRTGLYLVMVNNRTPFGLGQFTQLDEACAAAQTHHEARIRAVLVTEEPIEQPGDPYPELREITVRSLLDDMLDEGSDKSMWKSWEKTIEAAQGWHKRMRCMLAMLMLQNREYGDETHKAALEDMVLGILKEFE